MSAIVFEAGRAPNARVFLLRWMKRLHVPLEVWSGRRRSVVALLIGALVFALGVYGWIGADLGGVDASRTALADSAQRLAHARRALAQLPALRAALSGANATATATAGTAGTAGTAETAGPLGTVGTVGTAAATAATAATAAAERPAHPGAPLARIEPSTAAWSSADDVRLISALALQSGVALLAVEPGAAGGEGVERMRPLQLSARTDFVHLMAFLNGLADLPVLIVPVDVTVKEDADALAMSATLQVFSALRPARAEDSAHALDAASLDADDDEDIVFFDPFSKPQMRADGALPDVSQWRLVGVLRDATRGLALLDTPDGATTVEAGQRIGAERVTRLDALGIVLANDGKTRTLALEEAS